MSTKTKKQISAYDVLSVMAERDKDQYMISVYQALKNVNRAGRRKENGTLQMAIPDDLAAYILTTVIGQQKPTKGIFLLVFDFEQYNTILKELQGNELEQETHSL